jgi:hypothetical protein
MEVSGYLHILDKVEKNKSCIPNEIRTAIPRLFSSYTSRYTDWVMPTHTSLVGLQFHVEAALPTFPHRDEHFRSLYS